MFINNSFLYFLRETHSSKAPEYPFSLGICAYVFDVVNEMDGLEIQLVQHHLSAIYLFSLALQ